MFSVPRTNAQSFRAAARLLVLLLGILAMTIVLSSCQPSQWNQYRHDSAGTGFVPIHSKPATSTSWNLLVNVLPPQGAESAIGTDGTIYVAGDAQGGSLALVAVLPNGTIKNRIPIRGDHVVGSPTVDSQANVYLVSLSVSRDQPPVARSGTLHAISRFANDRAVLLPDNGWSAAGPKILERPAVQIFVSAVSTRGEEIVVFDAASHVLERRTLCGPVVLGGGASAPGIVNLPVALYQQTSGTQQTFVAAMATCGVFVMTWDGSHLQPLWEDDFNDDDFSDHAAPVIFGASLVVVGRKGHLVAYDLRGGQKQWDYDSRDRILFPPGNIGMQVYLAAFQNFHVLDFNGSLLFKLPIPGMMTGSPAVSVDCAYVSSYEKGLDSLCLSLPQYQFVRDASTDSGWGGTAIDLQGNVYMVDLAGRLYSWSTK